jgi:hypothetical protein
MLVNLTFVPYDLSDIQSTRIPASRETREFDYNDGSYLLMVAPIPAPGHAWFDIGTRFKQDIPNILNVGMSLSVCLSRCLSLCLCIDFTHSTVAVLINGWNRSTDGSSVWWSCFFNVYGLCVRLFPQRVLRVLNML